MVSSRTSIICLKICVPMKTSLGSGFFCSNPDPQTNKRASGKFNKWNIYVLSLNISFILKLECNATIYTNIQYCKLP